MKKTLFAILLSFMLLSTTGLFAQSAPPETCYPKTVGYLSFIFPFVTINKNETTTDFTKSTTIGFPIGVNVLYSKHFGFSYEFTPSIQAQASGSKTSNILFDPGPHVPF
jgi:hypothetical protein